ncbi:central glycolytic genes regulator [Cytobacillus eiseniae]|uniref:Central glycolytic genes regulator n=1 Tax=Cytobacillus eiseniae TaxID=762947 RepID=A0ABS4RBP6_9BACI|nr:sugar-binding domain-containing protein [Cytobacillus eiseniae]MBP2240320.1 central glycolytic genes regulator [Cytobacillus eiseniae]
MDSLIDVQKRLLPDLLTVMQKRYHILHYIGLMEPVGRRSLSLSLNLTERVLRSEVDFLKNQDLITSSSAGMRLTDDGRDLLEKLGHIIRDISGIRSLEESLQQQMGIQDVIIVAGNSDESPWVKSELGRAAASRMKSILTRENIIAVTGGSTIAAVADTLTPSEKEQACLFVPARGGIGEDVKNQANSICAAMADRMASKYRVLYVPDQVSKDIYDSFIKEPEINEVLQLIKSASMVLHGIGDAMTMAERRKSSNEDLEIIKSAQAEGEAFGYYFNENGEVVHKVQTIGLQLQDLANIPSVIAVAGGASKAKAIAAYMKQAPPSTILITDEGAAKCLLKAQF